VQFLSYIGAGAAAIVMKAKWLGTDCAVKIFIGKDDIVQEVSILSTLRHPNVLMFMGVTRRKVNPLFFPDISRLCQESNNRNLSKTKIPSISSYWLITEYCRGGTLYELIHRRKTVLTIKMKIKILIDIVSGLHYLHSGSILHGDLKSLNVLLDNPIFPNSSLDHIKAKVADFGLSRYRSTPGPSGVSGTYLWMAPEVFLNNQACIQSDVYSFGILAYEVFTSSLPYQGINGDARTVAERVARHGLRPDFNGKTGVPTSMIQLIEMCLCANPEQRLRTGDILRLLNREISRSTDPSPFIMKSPIGH